MAVGKLSRVRAAPAERRVLFRFAALAALSLALVASRAAHAQVALDRVWLASGGVVQGSLIEQSPTAGVRILLADGTIRTIPAAAILRVEYATPTDRARDASRRERRDDGSEHLTIVGDWRVDSVVLQEHVADDRQATFNARGVETTTERTFTRVLCVQSCDRYLQRPLRVRVAGDGVTPSEWFVLERGVSELAVRTGDSRMHVAGMTVTTLGILAALTSLSTSFLWIPSSPQTPAVTLAMIGVPLALLIPGGLMWGANRTTVQDNLGHRF